MSVGGIVWGMGMELWGSRSSVRGDVKRRFDLEALLGVRGLGTDVTGSGAGRLSMG